MEVRQHHELVKLHFRKVGRTENHVRPLDHELPIDPAPQFPIGFGSIVARVQAVELEHRFDAVPLSVVEQDVPAVEQLPIVPTPQRSLGQAVWHVSVLDVLSSQPQLAVNRLDVERQMAGGGTVILVVFAGHEVEQVRTVGLVRPRPVRRELQVEPQLTGSPRFTIDLRLLKADDSTSPGIEP